MKQTVYIVEYVDYANRKHLHFCVGMEAVKVIKMNYDVISVEVSSSGWLPKSYEDE